MTTHESSPEYLAVLLEIIHERVLYNLSIYRYLGLVKFQIIETPMNISTLPITNITR
jgi:hypothetical protein